MKKIAVCVGVSNDLLFAAGTVLVNFIQIHGDKNFEFLVFSQKFSKNDVRAFNAITQNIRLIYYKPMVKKVELYRSRAIGYFSELVLSKFEVFKLTLEYKAVVWLDYDIVIIRDFTDLLTDETFDFAYLETEATTADSFSKPPLSLDMNRPGISGALLIVRDTFPSAPSVTLNCYKAFEKYGADTILPEQGIIELETQEFEYQKRVLENQVYCAAPMGAIAATRVIHSWGPSKFWNGNSNEQWEKYHQKWVSAGGSSYSHWGSKFAQIKRKIRFAFYLILTNFMKI